MPNPVKASDSQYTEYKKFIKNQKLISSMMKTTLLCAVDKPGEFFTKLASNSIVWLAMNDVTAFGLVPGVYIAAYKKNTNDDTLEKTNTNILANLLSALVCGDKKAITTYVERDKYLKNLFINSLINYGPWSKDGDEAENKAKKIWEKFAKKLKRITTWIIDRDLLGVLKSVFKEDITRIVEAKVEQMENRKKEKRFKWKLKKEYEDIIGVGSKLWWPTSVEYNEKYLELFSRSNSNLSRGLIIDIDGREALVPRPRYINDVFANNSEIKEELTIILENFVAEGAKWKIIEIDRESDSVSPTLIKREDWTGAVSQIIAETKKPENPYTDLTDTASIKPFDGFISGSKKIYNVVHYYRGAPTSLTMGNAEITHLSTVYLIGNCEKFLSSVKKCFCDKAGVKSFDKESFSGKKVCDCDFDKLNRFIKNITFKEIELFVQKDLDNGSEVFGVINGDDEDKDKLYLASVEYVREHSEAGKAKIDFRRDFKLCIGMQQFRLAKRYPNPKRIWNKFIDNQINFLSPLIYYYRGGLDISDIGFDMRTKIDVGSSASEVEHRHEKVEKSSTFLRGKRLNSLYSSDGTQLTDEAKDSVKEVPPPVLESSVEKIDLAELPKEEKDGKGMGFLTKNFCLPCSMVFEGKTYLEGYELFTRTEDYLKSRGCTFNIYQIVQAASQTNGVESHSGSDHANLDTLGNISAQSAEVSLQSLSSALKREAMYYDGDLPNSAKRLLDELEKRKVIKKIIDVGSKYPCYIPETNYGDGRFKFYINGRIYPHHLNTKGKKILAEVLSTTHCGYMSQEAVLDHNNKPFTLSFSAAMNYQNAPKIDESPESYAMNYMWIYPQYENILKDAIRTSMRLGETYLVIVHLTAVGQGESLKNPKDIQDLALDNVIKILGFKDDYKYNIRIIYHWNSVGQRRLKLKDMLGEGFKKLGITGWDKHYQK